MRAEPMERSGACQHKMIILVTFYPMICLSRPFANRLHAASTLERWHGTPAMQAPAAPPVLCGSVRSRHNILPPGVTTGAIQHQATLDSLSILIGRGVFY
ncbi:hypothetical protein NXC14_PC00631 (plasmid) [Rhizobium sp. NXC14]|nr:hypothetical protein NXC14_PC00631 [Rhizobium sp. NXC14]